MLTNYHTHTFRCGHAAPVPDEAYVEQAIESGYAVLGFSDHTPWPYPSGFENRTVRMPLSQLPEYFRSIRSLREKYRGRIEIRLGLECEYFPAYLDWLRGVRKQVDYLILGNHFALTDEGGFAFPSATEPEQLALYAQYTTEAMRTGLYAYLAHPEIVLAQYPEFDRAARTCAERICETALETDMPLEYNLYGVDKRARRGFRGLGYPCEAFWEIAARMGCKAIIGVDAHQPEHLARTDRFRAAQEYLNGLGMELLTRLPLPEQAESAY